MSTYENTQFLFYKDTALKQYDEIRFNNVYTLRFECVCTEGRRSMKGVQCFKEMHDNTNTYTNIWVGKMCSPG